MYDKTKKRAVIALIKKYAEISGVNYQADEGNGTEDAEENGAAEWKDTALAARSAARTNRLRAIEKKETEAPQGVRRSILKSALATVRSYRTQLNAQQRARAGRDYPGNDLPKQASYTPEGRAAQAP